MAFVAKHIFILIILNIVHSHRPNVCDTFIGYYTMDPRNCWYNPEFRMETPELIKRNGYPFETYETATEDGYLLTVFRMPKNNPKGVIYLQHPAISSSTSFVDKGKNRSLGFILWDNGYDIWLGNFRGNYYSRKHMYLDPNQPKYWNFSFHEHGIYDITTQIDLIANKTNASPASITFIGVSMGCTAGGIYAAEKVEHSKKWLKVMILLAPPMNLVNTLPILKMASPFIDYITVIAQQLKVFEFLAYNKYLINTMSLCRNAPTMILCLIVMTSFSGELLEEIAPDMLPIFLSNNPAGVSTKSLIHYGQLDKNGGDLAFYDYGREKNLEYYHTEKPPLYHTENIAIPLFSLVGDKDNLAAPSDVAIYYQKLPDVAKKYGVLVVENMSHIGFSYAANIRGKVYLPVLDFLNKIYESGSKN